jgi:pimeloyl-ACP methyl ester carboxylesterase
MSAARTRWVIALTAAALSGVVAAAAIPRGPTTGAEVALLMLAALVVGVFAGSAGSRWAVLLAPALHLAGYELARASLFRRDGPTFGGPRFDVTMGVLLFLATHVMYAVVVAAPMVLGAIAAAAWTRRRAPHAASHVERAGARRVLHGAGVGVRRALTIAFAVSVALLAVQLVRPGGVRPVLGADGVAAPGGVATLEKVRLGGVDQWISMRGRRVDNPVLLHLSGGPGSSDVGWVRRFNEPLEEHFTVVVWEQRGVGKSYPALDPTDTLTLDRMVADGVELTRWLMARFDQRKVFLTGNSWGSTLGVLMVQREPDLFWAYVGTGQMVSQRETDRALYRQLLGHAAATGDTTLAEQLRALGEPPYRDVLGYAKVMEYYDVLEPYPRTAEFERARGLSGFFPDEYSLLDTWNEIRGFADMGGLLYPNCRASTSAGTCHDSTCPSTSRRAATS